MSYRLKKDLRNIIKFYGSPARVVKAEEIIRASGARADLNKAIIAADLDRAALVGVSGESFRVRSSGEPAYVGALSLENLNLFFI